MKFILILINVFLVSACATQGRLVQDPAEYSKTQGYILAYGSSDPYSLNITLKNSLTKEKFQLDVNSFKGDASVGNFSYGRWLPPGEYQVVEWHGNSISKYPNIKVDQGRLTYLGIVKEFALGGGEMMVVPFDHPSVQKRYKADLADLGPYLNSGDVTKWKVTDLPSTYERGDRITGLGFVVDVMMAYNDYVNQPKLNDRLKSASSTDEFLKIAFEAATPIEMEPAVDDSGNLFYGTNLGQVRMRSPQRSWTTLDTGTLATITALEWYKGTLYVALDNGTLISTKDRGKTWAAISHFDNRTTRLVDIDYLNEDCYLLMAINENGYVNGGFPNSASLYRSRSQCLIKAQPIKEIDVVTDVRLPMIWAKKAKNNYYIQSGDHISVFNWKSESWSTIKSPSRIDLFDVSSEDDVLMTFRNQGMFSKLSISTDSGNSWKESGAPSYTVKQINFLNPTEATAVRYEHGAWTATLEFLALKDGKWKKLYDGLEFCNLVLNDQFSNPVACVTNGDSIMSYDSNRWRAEYIAN